jgi:hypothetical protein
MLESDLFSQLLEMSATRTKSMPCRSSFMTPCSAMNCSLDLILLVLSNRCFGFVLYLLMHWIEFGLIHLPNCCGFSMADLSAYWYSSTMSQFGLHVQVLEYY